MTAEHQPILMDGTEVARDILMRTAKRAAEIEQQSGGRRASLPCSSGTTPPRSPT